MESAGFKGKVRRRASTQRAAMTLLVVIAFVCTMLGGGVASAASASPYNMGICEAPNQTGIYAMRLQGPTPTLTPSPSQATAAAHGYGYVYDSDCTGSTNAIPQADAPYEYNSLGLPNQIARVGTGQYQVLFGGLGLYGGVAHVTAYGANQSGQCKIGSWWPQGFDQLVNVYCFDAGGAATDRQFTASYTNQTTSDYNFGYLWANAPTASSYTPATTYQFSSAGSPNTIVRNGVGQYTVTMTGFSSTTWTTNNVMVSAYGVTYLGGTIVDGAVGCKVGSSGGLTATVDCYSGNTPTDAMFTLTYVGLGNILGAPNAPLLNPPPTVALPSGYAYVAPGDTTPSPTWRFSTAGTHTWAVSYDATNVITQVSVPVSTYPGDVQVVAFGGGANHCEVTHWAEGAIGVQCWNGSGAKVAAPFNVFFTGTGQPTVS